MSTINLIPPRIKSNQRIKKISVFLYIVLFVITIMVGLTYLALFATDYYAKQELQKSTERLNDQEAQIAELTPIQDKINSANAKITKISTLKEERTLYSDIFEAINRSTPSKVRIQSIQVDTKTNLVSITGYAETRRDIVRLQTELEDLEYFQNLTFSQSNYNPSFNAYSFNISGENE